MTHLAFPTGNAAGFSPARGYVSRTHESRCASASTWPALIERALSYGLCRASTVRRALRDSNPSGALRRLGWDIHRRVRAKCAAPSQDIAPPLPKQLLQGRRLTSLSTARREEIAEWLLEACQAGLVSQADLSSALASPDTDSSLLTLAVNAWHALTDQVHADAQARGITGRERSSHAVAPGWALSVPDDQVEAVFLEHLDNCDVSSLDWNALSPVDTRAILIGLALLHRNLQSLVVFCPGSFYGEESMLGGMNDSVVEQFAGTHRFTDDSSPPIDLVAAYEAETGIDLLTDPEAWEGVKRLLSAIRHAKARWPFPKIGESRSADLRAARRAAPTASRPIRAWLNSVIQAVIWIEEFEKASKPVWSLESDDPTTGVSWFLPASLTGDEGERIDQFLQSSYEAGEYFGHCFVGKVRLDTARRAMMEAHIIACMQTSLTA